MPPETKRKSVAIYIEVVLPLLTDRYMEGGRQRQRWERDIGPLCREPLSLLQQESPVMYILPQVIYCTVSKCIAIGLCKYNSYTLASDECLGSNFLFPLKAAKRYIYQYPVTASTI